MFCFIVSLILFVFVQENLKREEYEEKHRQELMTMEKEMK